MKRAVICAALLAVMTVTGIMLDLYTERVTADISARLAELAVSQDEASAAAISEDWERFCADNIFLTNNECAFEISEALVHIIAEIRDGDGVAEECAETGMLLDIYDKSRRLSLANIF